DDLQNIYEELAEFINSPSWNRPTVYDDGDDDMDYTIAITPVLSTEEPDNSLKVEKIIILEDEEIKDDNLCEKLLKFPPTDRSNFTHEEFGDKPAHITSPPKYDCFYFGNFPDT
nr:hypothetical protein [Tanacetum cinerariifolium]